MTQEKRLDKVEKALTPKQAVVHWLLEIQEYRNALEYVQLLRSQPESAAPVTRLTTQIDQAVRKAMKGNNTDVINAAVRRAVKDVVFLIKLHLQVNFNAINDLKRWRLSQVALAEALHGMHVEILFRNIIVDMVNQINYQTPYPLEPNIAASVNAAIRNHVYTFERLEEGGIVEDWLWDYLINKGAKELPADSYEFKEGQYHPTINDKNEKDIRSCFQDNTQFELFQAGKDYTHGLAGISDVEYNAHYGKMMSAIRELVDSGKVKAGASVFLETVPIPFLWEIPLVDGKWLDRQVVELAEWGAFLQSQGYQLKEDTDQNPLFLAKCVHNNGKEVDQTEIQMFQKQAVRHLAKFQGRTKIFDDRVYLHFEDYCAWRGRIIKGDLRSHVKEGFVTSSWNKWVGSNGDEGTAKVNGVPVNVLFCSVKECSFYSCPNVVEKLQQRERLLKEMCYWQIKPGWKEQPIAEWKYALTACLVELYSFRQALDSINKSYFDGQQVLFPDSAKEMTEIITSFEKITGSFNEFFADILRLSGRIDLVALRQSGLKEANHQTAYLVDMAKAEALSCLGDEQAAMKLAERYL